jgi:hypothetical protein
MSEIPPNERAKRLHQEEQLKQIFYTFIQDDKMPGLKCDGHGMHREWKSEGFGGKAPVGKIADLQLSCLKCKAHPDNKKNNIKKTYLGVLINMSLEPNPFNMDLINLQKKHNSTRVVNPIDAPHQPSIWDRFRSGSAPVLNSDASIAGNPNQAMEASRKRARANSPIRQDTNPSLAQQETDRNNIAPTGPAPGNIANPATVNNPTNFITPVDPAAEIRALKAQVAELKQMIVELLNSRPEPGASPPVEQLRSGMGRPGSSPRDNPIRQPSNAGGGPAGIAASATNSKRTVTAILQRTNITATQPTTEAPKNTKKSYAQATREREKSLLKTISISKRVVTKRSPAIKFHKIHIQVGDTRPLKAAKSAREAAQVIKNALKFLNINSLVYLFSKIGNSTIEIYVPEHNAAQVKQALIDQQVEISVKDPFSYPEYVQDKETAKKRQITRLAHLHAFAPLQNLKSTILEGIPDEIQREIQLESSKIQQKANRTPTTNVTALFPATRGREAQEEPQKQQTRNESGNGSAQAKETIETETREPATTTHESATRDDMETEQEEQHQASPSLSN